MAVKSEIGSQLKRVRSTFLQELDINKLLPHLLRRNLLTSLEEKEIQIQTVPEKRTEVLLDILSTKDRSAFIEFCRSLEECSPHLLTVLLLDAQQEQIKKNQSSIELDKGDFVCKAQEDGNIALIKLEDIHKERSQAYVNIKSSFEKESELGTDSPFTTSMKMDDRLIPVDTEQGCEENGLNVRWEIHHVTLHKVPTFGFGIAVSGGFDSPYFDNGDPSVAISDVIEAGPAAGKLQINDRILSVNEISLENVDHSTAISVLKESGSMINLVVKRQVLQPVSEETWFSQPCRVILSKKNKRDEFGVVLGCKLFIREILPHSLASDESGLSVGDAVQKINNTSVENLSLADAKRLLDRSKELELLFTRDGRTNRQAAGTLAVTQNLPPTELTEIKEINMPYPRKCTEEDIYVKDPTSAVKHSVPKGAYPNSAYTKFDGHYVLDNDLPSWTTLPRSAKYNISQKRSDMESCLHDLHDGYNSEQDEGTRSLKDSSSQFRSGSYIQDNALRYPGHVPVLTPRRVTFYKDKQSGLGLRLAGGNATGIFIASVQPGSAGEQKGLVEGDRILMANERKIAGLVREESVSYLTSLERQISLVVMYRKEEYERLVASRESGDSFYIRTHFNHKASDAATEHSFKVGDIFHVKDTLFRGIGGQWLALKVSDGMTQNKRATVPSSKVAEVLMTQQKEDRDKENRSLKRRGSLFRRRFSTRKSKSLGKDAWEEIIFAGLGSRFPAYERVVYREPGFIRPVVIFGAISDIARERLLAEYPGRFDAIQASKSTDTGEKEAKNVVITLGSIREAISHGRHCLLDVTPLSVDKLNYAQCNPIVIFLKTESKDAVKDVRSLWKKSAKSPRKLFEQSEKIEKEYSHLFTAQVKYTSSDAWFPRLFHVVESQQRRKIWISEKQPIELMDDDLVFPMSSRLSCTTGASSTIDIPRPQSDLDISPMGKRQSSSNFSVNTVDNTSGIASQVSHSTYSSLRKPSHDSRYSDINQRSSRSEEYQTSRECIDVYATLTPSEKLKHQGNTGRFVESGHYQKRSESEKSPPKKQETGSTSLKVNDLQVQQCPNQLENQIITDSSSNDSYSKYINSPQNKHDDTKLLEKLENHQVGGKENSPRQVTTSAASGSLDTGQSSDHLSISLKAHGSTTSSNLEAPISLSTQSEITDGRSCDTKNATNFKERGNSVSSSRERQQSSSHHHFEDQQQPQQLPRESRDITRPVSSHPPSFYNHVSVDPKAFVNRIYMNQNELQSASWSKLTQGGNVRSAGSIVRDNRKEETQARVAAQERTYT